STCCHCVNFCGINVKTQDGVLRVIYPDEDRAAVFNHGICPKGASGVFNTYNPYRLKVPLKRTNPHKGIDVDPQWVEISWEEALNTIAERLKKIRAEDPRKLVWHHGHGKYLIQDKFPKAFCKAFGTPNVVHRTTTCEAARHVADELTWGYHEILPDVEHCNLLVMFGVNPFEAEQWARWLDHAITDARERGMKLVVVDPRMSHIAAKADQWIPVRPGKDVVLVLALARRLIETGRIDRDFLLHYTNAPQLVGEDGHILKGKDGQPLVWDAKSQSARPYGEGVEPALEGSYQVDGKAARTAFQVFKDSLKEITPSYAEEVTGVPAAQIAALADEMGEAAKIGATVVMDGKRLRYRPVAVHTFRGMAAKEFGVQNWRSGLILQMLLGDIGAVGGLVLHHPMKHPDYLEPSKCEYPPKRVDLQTSVYFPHATHNVCQQVALTILDPEAYGLEYRPEMQIIYATNRPFSTSDARRQFEGYAKTFNVVIDIVMTETAHMADIVLPDLTYLEAWQFSPTRWTPGTRHTAIRQPMTNAYNIPLDAWGIIWELAKRVGIRDAYAENINKKFKLKKHTFKKGRDYTSREAVQIIWEEKTKKPFSYALEHAFVGKQLSVEERYLHHTPEDTFRGPGKPKMKLYADQLLGSFEKVSETVKKYGIENIDLERYRIALSPLPTKDHAFPTPHREAKDYPFYLM
ncbi:MAG: molybdopterin oxidoreductase, partial [Gammaproteobacteria bacterium]